MFFSVHRVSISDRGRRNIPVDVSVSKWFQFVGTQGGIFRLNMGKFGAVVPAVKAFIVFFSGVFNAGNRLLGFRETTSDVYLRGSLLQEKCRH